ncbi:hypothetical protein FLM48_06300 [Shewanella sp. Scap07]|uniref:DUF6795 domain-containing protein n=1 Tax=Shewanella sp. Scap07 TaxID=2589987 RepID=UPI0015C03281|nr:DUF6795 domain-containing protein [Shewanella sp. Scap07]QLE84733.1 hypothetical protein FLM48_06300 [Shewanella sp. Scap07]
MALKDIFRKLSNHIGTHKVHLCPEVKGRLVNNGQPLANVRITRGLYYSDGKYTEDECYTDNNGNFSMPAMSLRSSQPSLLIAEKMTHQQIIGHISGVKYKLWSSTPSGIEYIEEYAVKLSSMIADISYDETSFYFNSHQTDYRYRASGICRWNDNFVLIDHEAEFAKMIEGAL